MVIRDKETGPAWLNLSFTFESSMSLGSLTSGQGFIVWRMSFEPSICCMHFEHREIKLGVEFVDQSNMLRGFSWGLDS